MIDDLRASSSIRHVAESDEPIVSLDAHKLHDDLLAARPEGARHDEDICPFCVDKATQIGDSQSASDPSGSEPSGASHQSPSTEGGINPTMSDNEMISRETHEALLAKALQDATAALEGQLAAKSIEVEELAKKVDDLTTAKAAADEDNERLNKELDSAQVSLKAATDEIETMKDEAAKREEAARLAELASKRAEQVENLGLFPKEYITEKASAWASMDDSDWAERLEEWRSIKPVPAEGESTDQASAMTGDGGLTSEPAGEATTTPARRAVLGLS